MVCLYITSIRPGKRLARNWTDMGIGFPRVLKHVLQAVFQKLLKISAYKAGLCNHEGLPPLPFNETNYSVHNVHMRKHCLRWGLVPFVNF